MPVYKTNAIVLRRIPLGETDKILTLFSREFGKYSAVAKGARKTTSRLAGATEPLMLLQALMADGLNLDVLTQCEVKDSFPTLRGDFGLFLRATYACELMDKVTEERDSAPEAFDLLVTTLRLMERSTDPDTPLHAYELKLLAQMGYEPRLDSCARCDANFAHLPGAQSAISARGYSAPRGGLLCAPCADAVREEVLPLTPETGGWLYFLAYEGNSRTIETLTLPPDISQEISRILREHLRFRLERDIRSTTFLDAHRLGALDVPLPHAP